MPFTSCWLAPALLLAAGQIPKRLPADGEHRGTVDGQNVRLTSAWLALGSEADSGEGREFS